MKQVAVFILFSFLIVSCESQKHYVVKVINALDQKPVDSAAVLFGAGLDEDYTKSGNSGITDSNGLYQAVFMIGCAWGCYDVKVDVIKKGFIPFTLLNPPDTLTVILQPK